MAKFSVGDIVCDKITDIYSPFLKRTVIQLVSEQPEVYLVEDKYGNIAKVNDDLIVLPEEAEQTQTKLEQEFSQLQLQLQDKLDAAAQLINEAQTIANSHKKDLSECHEATRSLIKSLDNCGWQTSSFNC